jgi:hypothetical protein
MAICALLMACLMVPLQVSQLYANQNQPHQGITWVTVEGSAPIIGKNSENARDKAISEAQKKAIDSVVVSDISLDDLLVNLKLAGSMVGTIPYAEIVETIILEEGPAPTENDSPDATGLQYNLKAKIGVAVEVTGSDPAFAIEAFLNKTTFLDGEEMTITLKPTTDCFYSIFILFEDHKVLKLIPNRYRTDNFLAANTMYTLPDKADRARGILFRVVAPKEKESVSESVYVVALKQPMEFNSSPIQEAVFGIYDGQTAFIKDLIRQIIHIPLRERAEKLIQYQIRKP